MNLREANEFHRSPMQTEARYLPPHRREGGTQENVAGERPNAARAIAPQRIFFLGLIHLHNLEHMKETFLSIEARGASCNRL